MRRANQFTSIVTFCVSLALIWGASKMDYGVEYSPAAGFFPLWLGIIFALLSLALFFESIFGPGDKETERFFPGGESRKRILIYIAGLILCILMMGMLGFLIACFFFTAFVLIYINKYSIKKGLVCSLCIVAVLYALFNLTMGVPLPKGLLGI